VTLTTSLYAFFGGLLPAIIWLYFLLKEDSRCPEPPRMIWFTFILGMLVVPLVLLPEQWSCSAWALYPDACSAPQSSSLSTFGFKILFAWAAIEEILKYAVVAIFVFPRRAVDESPDYVIYMITAALGFAAAENMLFLFGQISSGGFLGSLITGNLRFIGATLLHVTASSAIGFALAFSYRKSSGLRIVYASVGLILAVLLHTSFNTLMMLGSGTSALSALLLVWSAAVIFFALFEILKYMRYRRIAKQIC
jgi:RsiW-degrading membrane proteinase PrsW (M82 family)